MSILLDAVVVLLFLAPLPFERETLSLDEVIAKWCEASRNINQFDASVEHFKYELVFESEMRQTGRFYYRTPRHGRLELHPPARPVNGRPRFRARAGESTTLIWSGDRILHLNDAERTYHISPVPNEMDKPKYAANTYFGFFAHLFWDLRKPQSFLPLILDLNADDLRRDFRWELQRINASEIRLSGIPLTEEWKERYKSVAIILDRDRFNIKAIKYVDWTGNFESVFVFSSVKINHVPADEDELLRPDLEKMRYKKIVDATSD